MAAYCPSGPPWVARSATANAMGAIGLPKPRIHDRVTPEQRHDTATGETDVIWISPAFLGHVSFDACFWTPWGTLITAEESWSGNADNHYLDAQATGCFCEKLPKPADAPADQRMGSVEHMHVIYADPQGGILRMTGGLGPLQGEALGGIMTIKLVSIEGGTRIDVDYAVGGLLRIKGEQIATPVDKVLGEQFGRLAALFPAAPAAPN